MCIRDRFRDADVAVVKASRDGGDNSHWQKNGQAYKAMVQAVKNACAAVDKSKHSKVELDVYKRQVLQCPVQRGPKPRGGGNPKNWAQFGL